MTALAYSASLRPVAAARTSRRRRVDPKAARASPVSKATDDEHAHRVPHRGLVGLAASAAVLLASPNAAHAETIAAIGRDADIDHGIVVPQGLWRGHPDDGIIGQVHNTLMVIREAHFPLA